MKNTIKVKSYNHIQEELAAAAAITPGMLVERTSNNTVQKHSTADGDVLPMFAIEDELQGGIIDTDYSTGNRVQVWVPTRGDIVNGLLNTGENVTIGTFLVSAGNGKLKAVSDPSSFGNDATTKVVGVAIEAINATAATKRILVQVI